MWSRASSNKQHMDECRERIESRLREDKPMWRSQPEDKLTRRVAERIKMHDDMQSTKHRIHADVCLKVAAGHEYVSMTATRGGQPS